MVTFLVFPLDWAGLDWTAININNNNNYYLYFKLVWIITPFLI